MDCVKTIRTSVIAPPKTKIVNAAMSKVVCATAHCSRQPVRTVCCTCTRARAQHNSLLQDGEAVRHASPVAAARRAHERVGETATPSGEVLGGERDRSERESNTAAQAGEPHDEHVNATDWLWHDERIPSAVEKERAEEDV